MPKLLRACASRLFHRSFTWMKITDYMVDRTIHLGPVFEVAEEICQKLLKLDAESNETINFIIFSPGGITREAFDIIEIMQMIKSPVRTICLGEVATAASLVLCAGSPGMRMDFPNSRVMMHEPRISLMYTHPAQTLIAANQLKSMEEKFFQYYARLCNQINYSKFSFEMERGN